MKKKLTDRILDARIPEITMLIILTLLTAVAVHIFTTEKFDDAFYINSARNEFSQPVDIKDVSNYSTVPDEELYNTFLYHVKNTNSTLYYLNKTFDNVEDARAYLSLLSHTEDFYFSDGFDAYIYSPLLDGKYTISIDLKSAQEALKVNESNKTRLDGISAQIISDDLTTAGILIYINQYILDTIEYDINHHDLASALDGKTRCTGYASLFKALAELNGIKADIVVGKEFLTDEGHAWVKVYTYGDHVVYFDPTYNDNSFYGNEYNFMSEEEILQDRTELYTTTYLLRGGYYNPALDVE